MLSCCLSLFSGPCIPLSSSCWLCRILDGSADYERFSKHRSQLFHLLDQRSFRDGLKPRGATTNSLDARLPLSAFFHCMLAECFSVFAFLGWDRIGLILEVCRLLRQHPHNPSLSSFSMLKPNNDPDFFDTASVSHAFTSCAYRLRPLPLR